MESCFTLLKPQLISNKLSSSAKCCPKLLKNLWVTFSVYCDCSFIFVLKPEWSNESMLRYFHPRYINNGIKCFLGSLDKGNCFRRCYLSSRAQTSRNEPYPKTTHRLGNLDYIVTKLFARFLVSAWKSLCCICILHGFNC